MCLENNFNLSISVPESIDNAVQNITDKPTQVLGSTLGDVFYLVFGGISHRADKRRLKYAHDLEEYRNELEQKVAAIPDENLQEPSIQKAAQAIDDSKYAITTEELRSMFANLIASTMDKTRDPLVHPSFSASIKQMSCLDARIIHVFSNVSLTSVLPLIDVQIQKKGEIALKMFHQNFAYIPGIDDDLLQISTSISSLERFGLIELVKNTPLLDSKVYDLILNSSFYRSLENELGEQYTLVPAKGHVRLTPLGKNFVSVCF